MSELQIDDNLNRNKDDFLDTTMGKIINNSIDLIIKAAVPDIIDDQVVNIKNAIIEGGFEEGIEEIKRTGINFKKSIEGIITGEFETIEQMKIAIKDGGILDFVSLCVNKGINQLAKNTSIDRSVLNVVEGGKDILIKQISANIENKYTEQLEHLEKVNNYCNEWEDAYKDKDLEKMNEIYDKIENKRDNLVQIESIINKMKSIENINKIINESNSFEITEEELELATKI